jgi:hypothetical protein
MSWLGTPYGWSVDALHRRLSTPFSGIFMKPEAAMTDGRGDAGLEQHRLALRVQPAVNFATAAGR